jgi:hypothetical protein
VSTRLAWLRRNNQLTSPSCEGTELWAAATPQGVAADRQRPQVPTDGVFIRELNRKVCLVACADGVPEQDKQSTVVGMTPAQVAVGAADFPPRVDLKGEETL